MKRKSKPVVIVNEKQEEEHKQYECPICLNLMCYPTALLCGHVVCFSCLIETNAQSFEKHMIKCSLCRKKYNFSLNVCGTVLPLEESIQKLFPQDYQKRQLEEQEKLNQMQLYLDYCDQRMKMISTKIMKYLTQRPIASYDEILENLHMNNIPDVKEEEIFHILSYAGVYMAQTFCICEAWNIHEKNGDIFRYAIRQAMAEERRKNPSAKLIDLYELHGDEDYYKQLPNHKRVVYYINQVNMFIFNIEKYPINSLFFNLWSEAMFIDKSTFTNMNYILPIVLEISEKNETTTTVMKTFTEFKKSFITLMAAVQNKNQPFIWPTWNSIDGVQIENDVIYSFNYTYHKNKWLFPIITANEKKLVELRTKREQQQIKTPTIVFQTELAFSSDVLY